jgi:hypothetical protein
LFRRAPRRDTCLGQKLLEPFHQKRFTTKVPSLYVLPVISGELLPC